jgi:hypothetical protein
MGSKEQINTKYCETKVFVKWPNPRRELEAPATFNGYDVVLVSRVIEGSGSFQLPIGEWPV